jgi:hypothetical protein
MTKILFTTSLLRAGTGILVNVDEDNQFTNPTFVAVNKIAGSGQYAYFINSATSNGRNFVDAESAWFELKGYVGAERLLPVEQKWLKSQFAKEYTDPLKLFKEELSEEKIHEREKNKLKNKKASSNLWLKSHGGKGFWN